MKNSLKILKSVLIFCWSLLIINFSILISNVLAASASFSVSGGGSVMTSSGVSATISVNSSSAYNAVTVDVTFTNLNYVSSSASSNWTPVSGPSRNGNTVSFSGAVLGNSYTGTKSVLSINFTSTSSAGTASIKASGNIALADGSGTQVTASSGNASYSVVTPTPAPKPAPDAPNISSSSHPNKDLWYKTKDVALSWNKQNGVTDFSYILDANATTTPDDTSEGSDTNKTFSNVGDGTSYFHIKAKNDVGWGGTSHFRISIDTSIPDPFTVTSQNTDKGTILYFSTADKNSGVARYNLNIDGVDMGDVTSGYVLTNKNASKIVVTAVDWAGNATQSIMGNNSVVVTTNITNTTQTPVITTQLPAEKVNTEKNIYQPLMYVFLVAGGLFAIYSGVITFLYLRNKKKIT